jgi:hypothetical protein
MPRWWANLLEMVSSQLVLEDETTRQTKVPELKELVERARRDWLQARAYFDNVTEPDLVDHAIYCIEAAERKYMYLLKQARLQGLKLSFGESDKRLLADMSHMHHSS